MISNRNQFIIWVKPIEWCFIKSYLCLSKKIKYLFDIFESFYHLKPSLVDDNAVYRLFPWGCPLLTHVSKNICSYLSCVSEVPRSSFLFERHLSEMMPPYGFNAPKKVLTHDVCQNFFGLFLCVRNFDTQKQATKNLPLFLLALSHFLLSLSLSICGLLAPLPRSSAPLAPPTSFDVSHLLHVNLTVISPPSPAHISPLSYRLMLRFFKPTQLPEVAPPDTCEPSPLEVAPPDSWA
jgi:hypothetical protein